MHKRPKTYRYFKNKVLRKPFLLVLALSFAGFLILLRIVSNRNDFGTPLEVLDSCHCLSTKTGRYHNFCYLDPHNSTLFGKRFSCDLMKKMENLDLISNETTFSNFSESIRNESQVVFVSATSEDHFDYSMSSFKCVREFYPNNKYILYGLGLAENYTDQLPDDQNFEFRKFDMRAYPDFVMNWKKYHFKGIVLADAIKDFPFVFWIDANIALRKSNLLKNMFEEISEYRMSGNYSSIISFRDTDHSNYAVLHPALLQYFPSNSLQLFQNNTQVGSGILFVVRTEYTLKVLKWWVLCSLTENCMNPPGSRQRCIFGMNRNMDYANCFRYDQSVLNLLLLNDFQENKKYFMKSLTTFFVRMKNEE